MKNIEETILCSPSLESHVQWRKELGWKVKFNNGVYWNEVKKGFYQPIHLLQKISYDQISAPPGFCWGYRAALTESNSLQANGAITVHLKTDLDNFSLTSLRGTRRRDVRMALKKVEFFEIDDPHFLQKNAYALYCSTLQRTKHARPQPKELFERSCLRSINPGDGSRCVIGGIVEGRLAGFSEVYCIEGFAYVESIWIASEYVTTNISSGINYLIIELCKRSPQIHTVIHGQHARENEALNFFKKDMGYQLFKVPAKVHINPLASYLLRIVQPHKYYRLTGQEKKGADFKE